MTERFSDEEARRLWARATELQAQAARRAEALSSGEPGDADAGGEGPTGYALDHVRQAAVEAGIEPRFIDEALAEARTGVLTEDAEDTSFADRFLGPGPNWLEAERTVDLSPRDCLAALRRVFPRLKLDLVDSRGRPEEGGVLVFEAGDLTAMMKHRTIMELSYASVVQIHASLHPTPGGGCRIVLRAPQVKQRRTSARIGLPATLVTGAGIGAATLAIGVSALATGGLTGIEAALSVGAGLGSGGGASVVMRSVWRALQNWGHRKGQNGLDRLLQLVVTDARTEGGFALPSGETSDDSDDLSGMGVFGM